MKIRQFNIHVGIFLRSSFLWEFSLVKTILWDVVLAEF